MLPMWQCCNLQFAIRKLFLDRTSSSAGRTNKNVLELNLLFKIKDAHIFYDNSVLCLAFALFVLQ